MSSSDSDTDTESDDDEYFDNNNKKKTKKEQEELNPRKKVIGNDYVKMVIETFEPFNQETDCRLEVKVSRSFDGNLGVIRYLIKFLLSLTSDPLVKLFNFFKSRFEMFEAKDFKADHKEISQYGGKFSRARDVFNFSIEYKIQKNPWTLQDLNRFQQESNILIAKHIASLCKILFPSTKVPYAYNPKKVVDRARYKIAVKKQGGSSSSNALDLTTTTTRKIKPLPRPPPEVDVENCKLYKYKAMSDNIFQHETWGLPENFGTALFPPKLGERFGDRDQGSNEKTIIAPEPAFVIKDRDNDINPTYSITVGARDMVNLADNNNNNDVQNYNENNEYTAFTFFRRFEPLEKQEYEYSTAILLKLNCPAILTKGTDDEPTIGILRLKF